ncbi:hypothetical protein EDD37DRAFT_623620 [Exophiala viscosa]|uniref:uncharacterized protein n=1 Tax=Exophiala viscosa TaxID=2486360 RepID=UPI00219A59CA|nr:hypothetical protein EDD37DRAFT_623620 [Exophiala viscosa]
MIPQVVPYYQPTHFIPRDLQAQARQDLDKRLKDIQYTGLVEEFVPKISDLQELGEKLDFDEESASSDLEMKVEEIVEQKKRKHFEQLEQKLDEIENWRKKMRVNIFGDAAQATVEDEAPIIETPAEDVTDVIRSSVEDVTAVIKTPAPERPLTNALPATATFPTGGYTPTVSYHSTSTNDGNQERSISPLARSSPTIASRFALPVSTQRSTHEEILRLVGCRNSPKPKSSRAPVRVKVEHHDEEADDFFRPL